jgi:hypothetical protein
MDEAQKRNYVGVSPEVLKKTTDFRSFTILTDRKPVKAP